MSALELAFRQGATMAEIDIQQTADDDFVLFHDQDLERTSTGCGPLWRHTSQQLRDLDAGSWFEPAFKGEKIPTLAEAVAWCRGKLKLNIELKMHGHERGVVELLASRLAEMELQDHCLVTSFDHGAVFRLSEQMPALPTGLIVGRKDWRDSLARAPVSVLSLEKSLATRDRIGSLRSEGKRVHVWTVNKVAEKNRLQEWGAQVLITNFPGLMTGNQP